jgi:hypothetical protein
MVQKGKVEETVLESLPQLVIQILNTYMLDQLQDMPVLTIFSISLSVLSLASTIWYYAYWNLFRCMSIGNVPSHLALYNYKLSGVTDGKYSFGKTLSEVAENWQNEVPGYRESVRHEALNDVRCDSQQGQSTLERDIEVSSDLMSSNGAEVRHLKEQIDRLREANERKEADILRLRSELQRQSNPARIATL